MNQPIEQQRNARDEAIFVRQSVQIEGGTYWKRRYDELHRFHVEQLARETENCKEISALRAALVDSRAREAEWQNRVNQLLQGEATNG